MVNAPPTRPNGRSGWQGLFAWVGRHGGLLTVLLAIIAYLPSLGFDFPYDDRLIIAENPRIRVLGDPAAYLATSWWNSPSGAREYRPATMASYALNYATLGAKPWGFHLVNVLLYGAACGLWWLFIFRLTGRRGLALAAGLLFAAHPLHVEVVAGIVGRAELMMAIGYFGALLAVLAGLRATSPGARIRRHVATAACAAFSMFSKEHGVLLLPTVAALALLPERMLGVGPMVSGAAAHGNGVAIGARGERLRLNLRRLAPALLMIASVLVIYFLARRWVIGGWLSTPATGLTPLDNPLVLTRGLQRVMSAFAVMLRAGALLVAPFNPSPDYSLRVLMPVAIGDPRALAGLLLVLLMAAGLWLLRARPAAWWGLALTIITYGVSSNIFFLIGTVLGERLLFLPSAGICLLVAALLLGEESPARGGVAKPAGPPRMRWKRALPGIVLGLWGLALLGQLIRYQPNWKDNEQLFGYMIRRVPESARAHTLMASLRNKQERLDEGIDHARRALQLYPPHATASGLLGVMLAKQGKDQEAATYLTMAYLSNVIDREIALSLAGVLTRLNRREEAYRMLQTGIGMLPRDYRPRLIMAEWLLTSGNRTEALRMLEGLRGEARGSDRQRVAELIEKANSP